MNINNPVFVLDSQKNSKLMDVLFESGVIPIRRISINDSLKVIRHEKLDAIFINNKTINEDLLEFILNVRDFNREIPVIISGIPEDITEMSVLRNQINVRFIEPDELSSNFFKKSN